MNLNGQTLAYIGDGVYELYLREYFIKKGVCGSKNLHNAVANFTSGKAQAEAYQKIKDTLTDTEIDVFKTGRNAKISRKSRNQSIQEAHESSGFEALIGYLYLEKKLDRINTLLKVILA